MKTLVENVKCEESKDTIETTVQKLHMEENFAYIDLPNMILKDPEQIKFTMMENTLDKMGNHGSLRVKTIKNAFKVIIDNIVCRETKAAMAILNNISVRRWVSICRANKRTKKAKYKLQEDPEKLDIESFVGSLKFSNTILDKWEKCGRDYKEDIEKFKRLIRKLVRTRNKILTHLKSNHDFLYSSKLYEHFMKQDHVTISEMANWFKDTPYVNPHELFDIPKKTTKEDEYQGDELTEYSP